MSLAAKIMFLSIQRLRNLKFYSTMLPAVDRLSGAEINKDKTLFLISWKI